MEKTAGGIDAISLRDHCSSLVNKTREHFSQLFDRVDESLFGSIEQLFDRIGFDPENPIDFFKRTNSKAKWIAIPMIGTAVYLHISEHHLNNGDASLPINTNSEIQKY